MNFLTAINGASLLFWMMSIDSTKGIYPFLIMTVNLLWIIYYTNRKEKE